MFGREARLPVDLIYGARSGESSEVNEYVHQLQGNLEAAFELVRQKHHTAHERRKEVYDRRVHGNPYKKDELVWLHDTVVKKGSSRKLHHLWVGPYRVVECLSDCDYRIRPEFISTG